MSDPSSIEETRRLAALSACGVLDTPRDPAVDAVLFTVAQLFRAPMGGVVLVAQHRAWTKSRIGPLPIEEPREASVANRLIEHDGVTVIEDASLEPRFAALPIVTGPMQVRMIAGTPVFGPRRRPIGALLILDRVARTVPDRLRVNMVQLARQASELLCLRVKDADLSR